MVATENEFWHQKVLAEQVRIIYQQLYTIMFGWVAVSLLIVILFWSEVSQVLLSGWSGAIIVQSFALLLPLKLAFKRINPPDKEMKKWGLIVTLVLGVYTATVGAMGALFYLPDAIEYQMLLSLFVVGSSAVLMVSTSSYLPAYHITCAAILAPLLVRYLFHGDVFHWELSIAIVVYWITLTAGCHRINQSLVKSLGLGYRNQTLIEEVTRQKEVAEHANLAKSRFLAAASHDLRQPLQAQALFVAELYARLHEPDKCRVILSRLDESIHAMRGLFNALLDISKLDAGVVKPKVKDFKISSLLAVIKDEYAGHVREKGLQLTIRCQSSRGGQNLVVRTDPRLLDCVLRNLIVNAIRYTQSGKVLVGCRFRGNYLSVEIWDTGPGIAEKYQQEIFQEFYQIENQQRDRSQGLGLGLSVVRRITKLLGCSLRLDSIEGKGSRFTVMVPLSTSDPETVRNHVKFQTGKHILGGSRVVVVEDDIAIQQAMQGLLESWGCQVLCADSGQKMLTKLSQQHFIPDIVLADYRLPGAMTGVQVVQNIRGQLNNNVPAILITGDTGIDKLQDVQQSAIPLMHKPVQPGKLRTLMQYLLNNIDEAGGSGKSRIP